MPVLRIGGANFDIDAAISATKIKPYRTDRAGTGRAIENALYFDVSVTEITTGALSAAIENFLTANGEDLRRLRRMENVEYFELDIGIIIDGEMMSRSTTLEPGAMAALSALDMTCTISAYRGGEE